MRADEPAEGQLGRIEPQLDWDAGKLREEWPTGIDSAYLILRTAELPSTVTGEGASGRVLEVAAADAIHACKLSLQGMESVVVEPSPAMLMRARARAKELGARVALVRGVAETLPFPEGTFDRVLIDSALDHLAEPELSLQEMTRVLKPDGRLVISFVNYGGFAPRFSRVLYRIARRLGFAPAEKHLHWDSPVPIEHTFECTYPLVRQLCEPHLELDRAFGVSIGWMVPGWSWLLERLPRPRALALVQRLDRVAERHPRLADFVVTVWRPRLDVRAAPVARTDDLVVRPTDVVHPGRARAEARYWERWDPAQAPVSVSWGEDPALNRAFTEDAARPWIDDLISRGPFHRAAALGCDVGDYEHRWLAQGGSESLDVYELSAVVIRHTESVLGPVRSRIRFVEMDLNFARLPEGYYDVVWSSGCLHHLVNLEHLFGQVERALRPGGLFAFSDYVGERRMQFAPERLARINAALREIPAHWRRAETVEAPRRDELSPFCAVRSDEILALARHRFDPVHVRQTGALFPLRLYVIRAILERGAPALAAQLDAAEEEAMRAPDARPCEVYAVFRKR